MIEKVLSDLVCIQDGRRPVDVAEKSIKTGKTLALTSPRRNNLTSSVYR